jgi:hypothetical protein
MRAHAEVEQNPVGTKGLDGGKGGRGGKACVEILDTIRAKRAACGVDRRGIAIDSQNPSAEFPKNRGVTAAAERAVDGASAACRPCAHGRGENRGMVGN